MTPAPIAAFEGVVRRGKGLGAGLGFATANLPLCAAGDLAHGVYAGAARVEGVWHPAVVNVGTHPTLPEGEGTVEIHLPGVSADLYGLPIAVRLDRFLRPERRFDSVDALRAQIALDVAAALGAEAK